MFSKKSQTNANDKPTKNKSLTKKEKKRLKKEKKRLKKEKKKNKRKHKRMQSYQEYNIDEHITPINFQPELRYSSHNTAENDNPNRKKGKEKGDRNRVFLKSKTKKHISKSLSSPTIPAKNAIFEGVEDKCEQYSYEETNGYKPPQIQTRAQSRNSHSKHRHKKRRSITNNQSRNSGKFDPQMNRKHNGTPIDVNSQTHTNGTMISHSSYGSRDNTMISRTSQSQSQSYSNSSQYSSTVTAHSSSDLDMIDTINHISAHDSNGNININTDSHRKKLHTRRTSAIIGQTLKIKKTKNSDGSIGSKSSNISTHTAPLPMDSLIKSQKRHKKKEFKYRKRNSDSISGVGSMDAMNRAQSTRVTREEKEGVGTYSPTINAKKYVRKHTDSYGNKLLSSVANTIVQPPVIKIDHLSSKKEKKRGVGGGYGHDIDGFGNGNGHIPENLRAYYSIQNDLEKLKLNSKKKSTRTQLDAIDSRLHTLFFANERTNIPNLAAFQKFFIDRMSVKSVHKDLDWHICLLRPKIHSRLQDRQIDSVINVVADILRKCVKKFNNKRGHLISAMNTHRIGVGTYGGGRDKNQIQSAYILSNKPSSSVPPEMYERNGGHTPSGSLNHLTHNFGNTNGNWSDNGSYSQSPYASDSEQSVKSMNALGHITLEYNVMTPPASVQLKQDIKKNKKEKVKKKHQRLLSFKQRKNKNKHKQSHQSTESKPNMSMQEIVALTGLPGMKKVKGSDHHNVDEPYPMELFHVSDMDFVLIYYVKFLTKFERIICEFLTLYQQYCSVSDDLESDVPLQLSLVGSNPRQTYMESMLKAYNTMLWGRQSREHPWIKVQTDKRKSQKFGQDLIYMVKYMKSNDIDALHELMKQCPDLNTKDRESGKTVLQIALDKSLKQPSFAFVARYLALKQLLFAQKLTDEEILIQALSTGNPMVSEILLHLEPHLSDKKCINLAFHNNYRNLARYMLKLNVPSWHNPQLIKRWNSACEIGDCVKLRSVLQRGFNIDYFPNLTQKTALIVCVEQGYKECVEFLLKNGANVNAQDIHQKTALHYAAMNLNGELCRLILEHRANWALRDLNHKTAIKYVMQKIGFVPHKKPNSKSPLPHKNANNLCVNTSKDSNIETRFRNTSSANMDTRDSIFNTKYHKHNDSPHSPDMYSKKNTFWKPNGFDSISDIDLESEDDSWDEYGFLVEALYDEEESEETESKGIKYADVDSQQIVKILDIACQACIPLDSRLLLLAVQRDWPHVILVLCQNHQKHANVDIAGKDGTTPLMLAAREGKKACLSALLQSSKPDLDKCDSADRTPIMHAAYRGEVECVQRLIKAGASIDIETIDGTTLLMAACYGGLDDFAKYLCEAPNKCDIDAVNENGFSALLFAASEGYQDTVSLLLNNNASIKVVSRGGLTPLMAGCSGGLHELVLYVLARINRSDMDETDENGWTALMHAVAAGSEKCAAILLKAGASVVTLGEDGYSLLSIAVMGNLIWMVRHILDCIKKQLRETNGYKRIYEMFNSREQTNGFTAIHEACGIGAHKCLALLIEYNKGKQFKNGEMILFDLPDLNGRTPLMIAALNGHSKCVSALLGDLKPKAQLNINKCDNEGNSTLIYAIESGKVNILKQICIDYPKQSQHFFHKTINLAKNIAKQRNQTQMLQILNQTKMSNINTDSNTALHSHSPRSHSTSRSTSHSISHSISHSHSVSHSNNSLSDEYQKYD